MTDEPKKPPAKTEKRSPGRPKGAKGKKQPGVRITPTVRPETLDYLKKARGSYGKTIDRLVKKEREKE